MYQNSVEEKTFGSFIEFINFILPPHDISAPFADYVFRGESAEYDLFPTLLREGVFERLVNKIQHFKGMPIDSIRVMDAEYGLLRDFYIQANLQGLNIPEVQMLADKNYYNKIWPGRRVDATILGNYDWLPQELFEITALAQHYELPTRLLDWSYNVSTAVYFACSGVFRKYKWSSPEYKKIYLDDTNSQNRFMVIWALDTVKLPEKSNYNIHLVQPYYGRNQNIIAQKGLFTMKRFSGIENDTEALDKFIDRMISRQDRPTLYRFKIPIRVAFDGMSWLQRIGINENNFHPGLSGVVKYVKRLHHLG